MSTQQWVVVIDLNTTEDAEHEATATHQDGTQLHWASNDPYTLMEAIGRDLSAHLRKVEA